MPRKKCEDIGRHSFKEGDTINNNPEGFVCNKIVELRKRTELSQYKFSLKYHINIRSLQSWEIGKRAPMFAIPYMLETVIRYEEKYGSIEYDNHVTDPCAKLRELRWRSGLTQAAFSDKFFIRECTLLRWEYDRAKPRDCILVLIEKILNYEEKYGEVLPNPEWTAGLQYII